MRFTNDCLHIAVKKHEQECCLSGKIFVFNVFINPATWIDWWIERAGQRPFQTNGINASVNNYIVSAGLYANFKLTSLLYRQEGSFKVLTHAKIIFNSFRGYTS